MLMQAWYQPSCSAWVPGGSTDPSSWGAASLSSSGALTAEPGSCSKTKKLAPDDEAVKSNAKPGRALFACLTP